MFIEIKQNKLHCEGFRNAGPFRYFFEGYVVLNDRVYHDAEFETIFTQRINDEPEYSWFSGLNGIFNLVIVHGSCVTIIRDRYGIIPVYFSEQEQTVRISDRWVRLLEVSDRKTDELALLEMALFGYPFDEKTLLKVIKEYPPHHRITYEVTPEGFRKKAVSYWEAKLSLNGRKRNAQKEFVDLWFDRIDVYLEYVKEHGNSIYMPFSSGLDCRLLAHSAARKQIDLFAMTYGRRNDDEISSAMAVAGHLKNIRRHDILELNRGNTSKIFGNSSFADRISCAFPAEFLFHCLPVDPAPAFLMTGYSGDFMAGSHLKFRMRSWKNKQDIADYILSFKSSPLMKELYLKGHDLAEPVRNSLLDSLPDAEGPIASFIRWDLENRQRRYIARSAFHRDGAGRNKVLLPFFDHELMDFFFDLPFRDLWNARLYINSQLNYLYRDNPGLIREKRVGRRQRLIRNNFIYEFRPKLITMIQGLLPGYTAEKDDMYADLDFDYLKNGLQVPDVLARDPVISTERSINILYLYSISQAHKKIAEW